MIKRILGSLGAVLVLLSCALLSCTPSPDRGKLSHEVWLPWEGPDGQYRIQKIRVDTVTSWSPLQGSAANLRTRATPVGQNLIRSQDVTMEYSRDRSGAIVPHTQFSVEVASIYAHFERLQKWDKQLGLSDADKPRRVYINFRSRNSDGSAAANNAFYELISDAFYINPYRQTKLPISVNAGILAHEYFHSIFARLLLRPIVEEAKAQKKELFPSARLLSMHQHPFHEHSLQDQSDNPNQSGPLLNPSVSTIVENVFSKIPVEESKNPNIRLNLIMLRGLNEGLADLWGWFYTNNSCYIHHSLSLPASIRNDRCLKHPSEKLEKTDVLILNHKIFPKEMDEKDQMDALSYELGTNLARLVYKRIEERGELNNFEVYAQWAQHIVKTLPNFLSPMIKIYVEEDKKRLLSWDQILDALLFGPHSSEVPKQFCKSWSQALVNEDQFEHFKKRCPSPLKEEPPQIVDVKDIKEGVEIK